MRWWLSSVFLVFVACSSTAPRVATPHRSPRARATDDGPRLAEFLPEVGQWRGSAEMEAALAVVEDLLFEPSYPWPDDEALRQTPGVLRRTQAEYEGWVARRRVTASRLPVLLWSDIPGHDPRDPASPASLALLGLALEDLPSARGPKEWRGPGVGTAPEAYQECARAARARGHHGWQSFCEQRLREVAPERYLLGDCPELDADGTGSGQTVVRIAARRLGGAAALYESVHTSRGRERAVDP